MVHTARQVVILVLRALGLVFVALAAAEGLALVYSVIYALRLGDGRLEWVYLVDAGGLSHAVGLILWAGLGVTLCLSSARLTLWLVPRVGARCLRCGHQLTAANDGVCPECGSTN